MTFFAEAAKPFMEINLGHVITWAGMVVGGALAWQRNKDRLDQVADDAKCLKTDMAEFTKMGIVTQLGQHERRLNENDINQKALAQIQMDVAVIKSTLSQLPCRTCNHFNSKEP